MSRQLDNWTEYTVEGKPFFGRFSFFKLHTTEKITITSESGVALSNPILSDAYGRTSSQVFLPDEDVTVRMESFIGSGEMSDSAENISAWKEERTFDSLKNSVIIDVDGETVVAAMAGNITELREMDPRSCNYAILCGYYHNGDMPPAFYKLEYDQNAHDTGGDVHRIDTEYIWRLITPRVLDIRVFGVFPANAYQSVSPEASNIANAFAYANTNGISVYLPQVYTTGGWYGFEGGNYTLQQTLYLDFQTYIVGKTGTTSTLYVNKIEGGSAGFLNYHEGYNLGSLSVSVELARSSWLNDWNQGYYDLIPRQEFIIDSPVVINNSRTYSDLERVYVSYHNWNPGATFCFDNIQEFQCPGNLSMEGSFQFYNMREIRDSWWNLEDTAHGGPYIDPALCSLTNCNYEIEDFLYVRNYVDLAYTNDNKKDFNLEGRTFDANPLTVYNNTSWSNGEIKNLCLTGNVTFRNIKGSVVVGGSASWANFQAEDCYLTGSSPYSISGDVYIKSCTFVSTSAVGNTLSFFQGSSCVIRDSLFNGYPSIQVPYNASITGCTFAPNALGADSNVYAYANNTNGYLSITFSNNVLTRAKLWLTMLDAQLAIVNKGSIYVGNSITDSKDGTNFIRWNAADMATTGHQYTYRNNDGPNVAYPDKSIIYLKNVPTFFAGDYDTVGPSPNTPPGRIYLGYTTSKRDTSSYINTYSRKNRLCGLTTADFNIFSFGTNDHAAEMAQMNVYGANPVGSSTTKYIEAGAKSNGPWKYGQFQDPILDLIVGIEGDISTWGATYATSDSDPFEVPPAYQDVMLYVELSNQFRIVS